MNGWETYTWLIWLGFWYVIEWKQVLEEQFLLSKEKEIEEKVRRKIELERVLEEKTKLNDKFSKLKMEIDMVKAEEDDRIADSAKYVAKALLRNVVNPFQSDALKKGMDRYCIIENSLFVLCFETHWISYRFLEKWVYLFMYLLVD